MNIKTKLNVGQTVYFVTEVDQTEEQEIKCSFCEGERTFYNKAGEPALPCGRCKGEGVVKVGTDKMAWDLVTATVDMFAVEVQSPSLFKADPPVVNIQYCW